MLFDPWLNQKSMVDLLGWRRIYLCQGANGTISNIIERNSLKYKKLSLTRELFHIITQIYLDRDYSTDYWKIADLTNFKFSSVYGSLMSIHNLVYWGE